MTSFCMLSPLFKNLGMSGIRHGPSPWRSAGPKISSKESQENFIRTVRLPREGRRAVRARSLRRGLGIHVDDLDAAVDRVHRRIGILRLVLAIADGDEIAAGDAEFADQIALDGIGAAFGQAE